MPYHRTNKDATTAARDEREGKQRTGDASCEEPSQAGDYLPLVVARRSGGIEVTSLALGSGAAACACSGAGAKQPPELQHFPLRDVADVIALEREIAAAGTPLLTLMERAGGALARFVRDAFPATTAVAVLCGSGNNGGDGWVAARLLASAGFRVTVFAVRRPSDLRAEPARTAACAVDLPEAAENPGMEADGSVTLFAQAGGAFALDESDLIIDCLLGTGFDGGAVKEPYRGLIEQANATRAFRLACDVPSGMSAQTGEVRDLCVHADATMTMLAVKTGLVTEEAAPHVGRLLLAPLGPMKPCA